VFLGDANEEREEADSLAALGMTNQKSKSNDKSRFPVGMTTRKAKARQNQVKAPRDKVVTIALQRYDNPEPQAA
jgi:hypothetical protein